MRSDTPWQYHIHRTHQTQRETIVSALLDDADADPEAHGADVVHPSRKLAHKLTGCCRCPTVYQDDENGQVLTSSDACNGRVCPRCAKRRGQELREVIEAHARTLDWPAMLTLTVRAETLTLDQAIQHLKDSFARLRRSKGWKSHVFGGVSVLEVKWSGRSGRWHPHLHILADMLYWPQAELAQAWENATGDSRICDVRRVSGPKEAANYVAKYASKGTDVNHMPYERIAEWAHAIHGRRLAQPFGSSHGLRTRLPRPTHPGTLHLVGWLPPLYEAAASGDDQAKGLLHALEHRPRLDLPSADGGPSQDDLAADADLADGLRDWFTERLSGADSGTPPPPSDTGPGTDRPDHRTQRLWEDSDPAVASGSSWRHPDSHLPA